MTRKAILQIGTEKTGTTSLQSFLAANRGALAERGYLYPRFCGDLNHTGLAAFAMEADRPDALKAAFGGETPEAVPQMRDRLKKLAEAELTGGKTAIFCSEHCHSRLVSPAEVWRLRDFLAEFFDEIEVSVYLRRQDRVALSLYSTMLKSGCTPAQVLPDARPDSRYYNYDRFLALWEEVFGAEAIKVRLFEPELLVNRNVIDDFLAVWGLGGRGDFRSVPNENGSISVAAQEFLQRLNSHLPSQSGWSRERLRGIVVATLERRHAGHGARPARAEARAFYERFRTANERVAARYFPERELLFSEDFSNYPETADLRTTDAEAIIGIAAQVLSEASGRIDALEAEISIREAAIAYRDDRQAVALERIRAALSRFPEHAGLHRTLGEYLLRLEQPQAAVAAAEAACARAPENWEYRHFLGIARASAGDDVGAAAAQQAALDINPADKSAKAALAKVLTRLETAARQPA
jgi:hypothetical protein